MSMGEERRNPPSNRDESASPLAVYFTKEYSGINTANTPVVWRMLCAVPVGCTYVTVVYSNGIVYRHDTAIVLYRNGMYTTTLHCCDVTAILQWYYPATSNILQWYTGILYRNGAVPQR